jgi:hypothetical protein
MAAALMLWALVRPCISGLVVGAAAGALAALPMLLPALRPPKEWIESNPSPMLTAVMLALPALAAITGLRRRQTRREWALSGFAAGVLAAAAIIFLPAAENLKRRILAGKIERRVVPHKFADWHLPLAKPGPGNPVQFFTTEATWDILLEIPRLPAGIAMTSGSVEALAWRADPDASWSHWIPARGDFYITTREHDWLLSVACDPREMRPLNNGELRVKTRLHFQNTETPRIELRDGASVSGEGWICEITAFSRDGRGGFAWTARTRTTFGLPDIPDVVPDLSRAESGFYDARRGGAARTRFVPKDRAPYRYHANTASKEGGAGAFAASLGTAGTIRAVARYTRPVVAAAMAPKRAAHPGR